VRRRRCNPSGCLRSVPIPERFFSFEEVARPIASHSKLATFALIAYVLAIVTFCLCYIYYAEQTISTNETVITRLNSNMEGYNCEMLIPASETVDYEYTVAVDLNLHDPIPFCNSSVSIDASCSTAADCPALTTYDKMFFSSIEDCSLGNAPVWNKTVASDDSYTRKAYFVAEIGKMSVSTPRFAVSKALNPNCTVDLLKAGIISYYTELTNGVPRACQPFSSDQNPPYSCSRTVEQPLFGTVDILSLAFGNTQLLFAGLIGLFYAVFSLHAAKKEDGFCTMLCSCLCEEEVFENTKEAEEKEDDDNNKWTELKQTTESSVPSIIATLRKLQEEVEANKHKIALCQQAIDKEQEKSSVPGAYLP
jgi:hypothetical protein